MIKVKGGVIKIFIDSWIGCSDNFFLGGGGVAMRGMKGRVGGGGGGGVDDWILY